MTIAAQIATFIRVLSLIQEAAPRHGVGVVVVVIVVVARYTNWAIKTK
jgi:hypothetical protein